MTNLNISLPEPMKDFIEEEVRTGRYSTPSEFVRELVREAQKKKGASRVERLVDALARGERITDDAALETLHGELRQRINKKLLGALKSPAVDGDDVVERLRERTGRTKPKRRA